MGMKKRPPVTGAAPFTHALDLGDGEPRGDGDIPNLQPHLEQLSCRGERLETLALQPALGLAFFPVSRPDLLIDVEVKKCR